MSGLFRMVISFSENIPKKPGGSLSGGGRAILQPAGPDPRFPVAAGVGLDVEDGRAVDEVEPRDLEDRPVPREQADDAHPQRVGAVGRARRENPARPGFSGRDCPKLEARGPVKSENDNDVRKAFQALEGRGEFVEDGDLALDMVEKTGRGSPPCRLP